MSFQTYKPCYNMIPNYGSPFFNNQYGKQEPYCPKQEKKPEKNTLDFNIDFNIIQYAESSSTGGNGGNGGSSIGGSAAASLANNGGYAESSVTSSYQACDNLDDLTKKTAELPKDEKKNPKDAKDPDPIDGFSGSVTAIGGNAGDGGAGGAGGNTNGGSISQEASISVSNVVVFIGGLGAEYPAPHVTFGGNGKKYEITTDNDGDVLVNGEKTDSQELKDGTKVFTFKSFDSKKTNA